MNQPFESHQFSDSRGNPAGGHTFGPGFSIAWQNGPLAVDVQPAECVVSNHWSNGGPTGNPSDHTKRDGSCRRAPNGAFVETIIAAAKDRLAFYQRSDFACSDNRAAIDHLDAALAILNARTAGRVARGVEGTHEV